MMSVRRVRGTEIGRRRNLHRAREVWHSIYRLLVKTNRKKRLGELPSGRNVCLKCLRNEMKIFFSDVTINKIDCDSDENQLKDSSSKLSHKDSVNIKREIIGILKPPNLKKELKSFPSLPECFLHDLGLLDSLVLR